MLVSRWATLADQREADAEEDRDEQGLEDLALGQRGEEGVRG
jgi:hypothetical protein